MEAWQPSSGPMQRAGQGGGILAPSLGVITKSETKAEDGGQTPQEFSEPSSLVPEFYKVPVASDPGPEGALKAADLAWTLSRACHHRASSAAFALPFREA